ncbi:MAG: hypothetical protein K1X48_09920 [Burkholderiaceae bacterium]|nr:hypothetical protein [Burkholderiaceae bacterium]
MQKFSPFERISRLPWSEQEPYGCIIEWKTPVSSPSSGTVLQPTRLIKEWFTCGQRRELLITYYASRIGSCGAQRTLRTHPLLKSAVGRSLRLLEVPRSVNPGLALMSQLL